MLIFDSIGRQSESNVPDTPGPGEYVVKGGLGSETPRYTMVGLNLLALTMS